MKYVNDRRAKLVFTLKQAVLKYQFIKDPTTIFCQNHKKNMLYKIF